MKILYLLFILVSIVSAWTCPACGSDNNGDFCSDCDLPQPPEGMEYIGPSTVTVDGEGISVDPFFIDREPVICRDILDWLAREISNVDQIPVYLTGQEELLMPGSSMGEDFGNIIFVRYTPWVIYKNMEGGVTGVTVQTGCFDIPAASITFDAARLYLNDSGKRLPTRVEISAAASVGAIGFEDTWEVMNAYSDFISMTLSGIIGISPSRLAMFSENQAPEERIMWEWTRDAWEQPPGTISDLQSPYALIFKPLDPPVEGTAMRESGYYNVIFRGIVPIPWIDHSGN
ncbi:MAG: hypothetical protein GQ565_02135 [Candidatus Aegiribacteria sp.]|nr:hypothetical protein [Candidatus Aegiribacteria sp.]